jgi:hypothetical protein
MSFDTQGFLDASLTERIAKVPVPFLQPFFGDTEPVWVVRNLTLGEMAQCKLSRTKAKNQVAIAKLASARADTDARVTALLNLLNCSAEVESEVTARIEMLVLGSVEPKISYDIAAKLARTHANIVWQLSDKIGELTDGGSVLEQPKPSGN